MSEKSIGNSIGASESVWPARGIYWICDWLYDFAAWLSIDGWEKNLGAWLTSAPEEGINCNRESMRSFMPCTETCMFWMSCRQSALILSAQFSRRDLVKPIIWRRGTLNSWERE